MLAIIEEEPNPENITTVESNTNTCTDKSLAAVDKIPVDDTIHTDTPNNTIKGAEVLEQTAAADRARRQEEQCAQKLEKLRTRISTWEAAKDKT